MFCFRRRCKLGSYPASPCAAPYSPSSSYPIQQNLPQNPPPYPIEPLSCPISYYPSNVNGHGPTSALDQLDERLTNELDGSNHYNRVRDPRIPPPPGVVVVQMLRPTAPPLPTVTSQPTAPPYIESTPSYCMQMHQQQHLYPKLSSKDQEYADEQRVVQK
ncbi:unnamed protein product [Strongylus vulgaris]|uniref:Uncharacterized protein n=1 Tax=Strongylus vulgaris TaxID=40348 RepID=A0A3P7JH86_STRVU|nr:unnamed protein product [Strongylus vulgaris]